MQAVLRLPVSLLLLAMTLASWGEQSSDHPSTPQRDKPRDSFVDFAFKQINAANTDFGCELELARKLAVEETIKSINFWTSFVALGFLFLSFVLLIHQHRESQRRELVAAHFLAQYHNAWVDARMRAEDAIRRWNELVLINNSPGEDREKQSNAIDRANSGERKKPMTYAPALIPNVSANQPISTGSRAAPNESAGNSVRPLLSSDADLIAQIKALQQQLHAAHEREKRLQKELNKVQPRVTPASRRDANASG